MINRFSSGVTARRHVWKCPTKHGGSHSCARCCSEPFHTSIRHLSMYSQVSCVGLVQCIANAFGNDLAMWLVCITAVVAVQ